MNIHCEYVLVRQYYYERKLNRWWRCFLYLQPFVSHLRIQFSFETQSTRLWIFALKIQTQNYNIPESISACLVNMHLLNDNVQMFMQFSDLVVVRQSLKVDTFWAAMTMENSEFRVLIKHYFLNRVMICNPIHRLLWDQPPSTISFVETPRDGSLEWDFIPTFDQTNAYFTNFLQKE